MLACLAAGVLSYANGDMSLAYQCFVAVGFGIRLDTHRQRRLYAEAERRASEGWVRLRGPVRA
ncbi:MAG: hypothetical protein WA906_08925 [Pacificimonas sp.]